MQVKRIEECSAIPSTFIKLPLVIMIFVLSIFEWPFYTGFFCKCIVTTNTILFLNTNELKIAEILSM